MDPVIDHVSVTTAVGNFHLSRSLNAVGALGTGVVWARPVGVAAAQTQAVCHVRNAQMTVRLHMVPFYSRDPVYFTANFSLRQGGQAVTTVTRKGNFGAGDTFNVQLPNVLPGEYEARLTVDFAEGTHPRAGSGVIKFKVCLVVGAPVVPAGQLSHGRLLHAYAVVGLSNSDVPHPMVTAIHAVMGNYTPDADVPYPWDIAAHFNGVAFAGMVADCQSMARYLRWILDILGYPGTVVRAVVVVFACPVKPHVALEALLPPVGEPPHTQNPNVVLGDIYNTNVVFAHMPPLPNPYAAVVAAFPAANAINFTDAVLLDAGNNRNNYEACFKLTDGGLTQYYPGGVGAPIANRITVLRAFRRMAWERPAGTFNTCYDYLTQQMTTYTVGGAAMVANAPFARLMRDGGMVANAADVWAVMVRAGDF